MQDIYKDFWYTYVLESDKDGKRYIGCTGDLNTRIIQHDNGEVISTKNRGPLHLVYFKACSDKYLAFKREKYFKTGFGRRFLDSRIKR